MKIRRELTSNFKWLLTMIGGRCTQRVLTQVQGAVNYLKVGRWMREHRFQVDRRLPDKWAVMDLVAERVKDRRVLYLEFGVYKGGTTRFWSRKLRNPQSMLHGFDSFEGLPENWGPHKKGHFDVRGGLPAIDDARVKFFKGWFNEVLPAYSIPEHDELILIMDADLYSSTIFVLNYLLPHIGPGTYIYFDEMNETDHEPRAFVEFLEKSSLKFSLLSVDRTFCHAFFQCTGASK